VNSTAPSRFAATVTNADRYEPGSVSLFLSEAGRVDATFDPVSGEVEAPWGRPLTRRVNRVLVSLREKETRRYGLASWMILNPTEDRSTVLYVRRMLQQSPHKPSPDSISENHSRVFPPSLEPRGGSFPAFGSRCIPACCGRSCTSCARGTRGSVRGVARRSNTRRYYRSSRVAVWAHPRARCDARTAIARFSFLYQPLTPGRDLAVLIR
jgi:hypothetical protein